MCNLPARRFWIKLSHGITVSLTILTNGGNGHIKLITELFSTFFQLMCRDAAHIHSATSGDWTGTKVQIQNRGGLLGILTVDFKEVSDLIQHNILRVGGLNLVVLPDSRHGFFLNRLGGFYRLCFLGFWLFFRKFTVNDCIGIITLFQLLRGSEPPGFHQSIVVFDHLCPRYFNPCAVRLVVADTLAVSPDMAHKVTGKCVISAANAVFVFQKIQLLFGCVG